jgi:hypothetical protein
MSAAATAAGYLYASGRLRGRNAREGEEADQNAGKREPGASRRMKVAVYEPVAEQQKPARPAKVPKIQYRTRRWKPNDAIE